MAKKIIRPIKGIDVDSSVNRISDNVVYNAKNLRLNSKEGSTLGEYTNIKGVNKAIQVDDGAVVGHTKIDDSIILIISGGKVDYISKVPFDEIPKNGEGVLTVNNTDYYWNSNQGSTYHKVFSGNLGIGTNMLEVKSYFESNSIQRVYWTTSGDILKSINIIKTDFNDPSTLDVADLEAVPSVDLTSPEFNSMISGSLISGKVFYAYKLSNNNGANTNLSELSKGIHLTSSYENSSTDYSYIGDGFDVDTGKGVSMTISDIHSSFSSAKVYAIHYLDDSSLPVVRLIFDSSVSSSLIFNDIGSALEEISAESFLLENNLVFSGGVLAIKNNRLFVANYDEEFFDIDDYAGGVWEARAYRFGSGGRSYLYDKNLTTSKYLTNTDPDWDSIPEDWDCINKNNSIEYETGSFGSNNFFKLDLTTLGADGENISITQEFDDKYVYPDYTYDSVKWNSLRNSSFSDAYPNDGYASYANPATSAKYRTFKPEEIYRIGIQFKNDKQQLSYVKWICDYKVAYDDSDNTLNERFDYARNRMTPIKLNFEVSNIPNDPETDEPFEFRIVYVPIEEKDISVVWGLFNPLYKGLDSKYHKAELSTESSISLTNYLDFVSPDYCFGIKKSYIKARLYKNCLRENIDRFVDEERKFFLSKIYDFEDTETILNSVTSQFDIEYSSDIEGSESLYSSDVLSRSNPCTYYGTDLVENVGTANIGRSQIIYSTDSFGATDNDSFLGCCYVGIFESQYGGNSYDTRKNSGYIGLCEFTSESSKEVYGDSFMSNFEYLRFIAENNVAETSSEIGSPEIMVFPAITTINLNLRSDTMFTRLYTQNGSYMIHEYAGVYEDTSLLNAGNNYVFTQETDLYLYNMTYSREQNIFKYYENQESISVSDSFPNRIIASDQKILGELSDSFLQFNSNTYIDVDGQYGEIKKMIILNERLYFFQERAIGVVAVNERSQTIDSTGNAVSIGEIGLLSRCDYLTTTFGLQDERAITVTNDAIFFCDQLKQEFLAISKNVLSQLSIIHNVDSLVKSIDLSNVFIVQNRKFNEVLFTYRVDGRGTQDALVYSEVTNSFSSVFDVNVEPIGSEHIDLDDFYDEIIINSNNYEGSSELFTLNDGNYNNFNDEFSASEVTFAINPGNEKDVLFNIIEFIAKTSNDSFLDTIRIYNDNYDTGEMLVSEKAKSKFGKFRVSSLRGYEIPGNKERILDNHIYITIKTKDNSTAQDRVWFRDFIATYSEYNYFG